MFLLLVVAVVVLIVTSIDIDSVEDGQGRATAYLTNKKRNNGYASHPSQSTWSKGLTPVMQNQNLPRPCQKMGEQNKQKSSKQASNGIAPPILDRVCLNRHILHRAATCGAQ